MRRVYLLAVPSALCLAVSCAFTLDFDKLQKERPDASVVAGAGGTAGTSTTAGTAGTAGGGGASGVPLDQWAFSMATAYCANINACVASAVKLIIHDEDCQTLFTNTIQDTTVAAIQQSVARGTITYDPVKAAQCVANVPQGTPQSPPVCASPDALIENCKSALGNLAGVDQPCNQRFDCQRGLACQVGSACPGRCRPLGQVGAACLQDGECDPTAGLYCRKGGADAGATDAGTAGACEPYVAIGASCTDQDQCARGGICINSICHHLTDLLTVAEGLGCYTNQLFCNPAFACEFSGWAFLSAGVCTAPKQPLDTCKLALPSECPKDYYCTTPNYFNQAGQCAALPTENQPCAAAAEQQPVPTLGFNISALCHAGLACVNGFCKPMRHLGEACEADAQCYSGACRAGADGGASVCVTPGCG
jgi:hypothetical protein